MPSFMITAQDKEGREYVYRVDNVRDEEFAAYEAFGYHGTLVRDGWVDFPLVIPYTVEEV